MASTAPVAPAALRTEDTASRVRSGQRMSGKMLGVAILPIVLLCAALGWYRWGVELRLTTEPSETQVVLDGTPVGRTMGPAGSLVLPHLGRGTHQLRLSHPGFDTWSQPVTLGWFQLSLPLNVKLPIPSFPLTVITVPGGARVLVDGKESGVSDQSGSLVLANVERGQHVATVTLNGYPSWSSTFFMQAPLMVRADLVAAAQVAERENAERLGRAQSLFEQRQYQAAVSECDEVLRVDPANQAAAKLKSQIQQTMAILGMQ
ncbi:MAG TPA: PEGA domain-containing protein [Dongiaceae bacterium]|nr:PEGA domain-containing protein [Dongiaceae bacterium]